MPKRIQQQIYIGDHLCIAPALVSYQTGLATSTLALYRRLGKGPDFLKLGNAVWYIQSSVNEYNEKRMRG